MDLTGLHLGNYVVTRQLGGGGMGTVWLCEHPLLHRRAALKVLHDEHANNPDLVERFFTEAKAANEIGHPNIVEVHDFGWTKDPSGSTDIVYLIMEFLEGKSLAQALPTLSIEEGLHIVKQCASALEASHKKGIVHRDLKPENIFLVNRAGDPMFVKIVDFGIAKLIGPHQGGKTRLGTVLGTPSYMSPEQCEGLGNVDARSDVYSLGVVLYEIITKRLPFVGKNFAEVVVGHVSVPPQPPSQINPRCSPEIEAIVLRAMEKLPERRFQSMAELAAALYDPATHALAYARLRSAQPTVHAARSGNTLILEDEPISDVTLPRPVPPPSPTPVPHITPLPAVPPPYPLAAPMPSRPTPLPMMAAFSENTLGGASGEVSVGPRKHHRGLWMLSGGVIVAGAVALALMVANRAPPAPAPFAAEPVPAESTPPEPAPAPPRMHAIVVKSDPTGAVVRNVATNGYLGDTPVTLRLAEGAAPIEIQIVRAGHKPARLQVAPDGPAELSAVLEPISPPDAGVAPVATPVPAAPPAPAVAPPRAAPEIKAAPPKKAVTPAKKPKAPAKKVKRRFEL